MAAGPSLLFENDLPALDLGAKPDADALAIAGRHGSRHRFAAGCAHNSHDSQMLLAVRFRLAGDVQVDRLTVRWPSGLQQVLKNIPGDPHIVVAEGNPMFERVIPGQTAQP